MLSKTKLLYLQTIINLITKTIMKATLACNGERVTLTENSRDLGHGKQIEVIYSDETKGWAHEEDLIDREEEEDLTEVEVK